MDGAHVAEEAILRGQQDVARPLRQIEAHGRNVSDQDGLRHFAVGRIIQPVDRLLVGTNETDHFITVLRGPVAACGGDDALVGAEHVGLAGQHV